MAPLIVTGYVPLKGPRSEDEYRYLGAQLTALPDVKLFETGLDDCWMFQPAIRYARGHAKGDNPAKNTLGYHVVQHQKMAWLDDAMFEDIDADPLIWIDFGVFHLPGVTAGVIEDFVARVAWRPVHHVTLPGCWPDNIVCDDRVPCWRFCGTVAIVPRFAVHAFDVGIRLLATDRLVRERFVTWEVNTWARFERLMPEMFRWYRADHDATLFTNYQD